MSLKEINSLKSKPFLLKHREQATIGHFTSGIGVPSSVKRYFKILHQPLL